MRGENQFQILRTDYYIDSDNFPLKPQHEDLYEYNYPRVSTIYTFNNEKFTGLVMSDGDPEANDYIGEVFYQFNDGSLIVSYSRDTPFFKYEHYGVFHSFFRKKDKIIYNNSHLRIEINDEQLPLDWDELSTIESIKFELNKYAIYKFRSLIFLSWVSIRELIQSGYILNVRIIDEFQRSKYEFLDNEIVLNNFIQLLSDFEINERHKFSFEHGCYFDFEINSRSRDRFENEKILDIMVAGSFDFYYPDYGD